MTKWEEFNALISSTEFDCNMHLAASSRLFIHFFKQSEAFKLVESLENSEKADFIEAAIAEIDDIVSRPFDSQYCNPWDAKLAALFISVTELDRRGFSEWYYKLADAAETCNYLSGVVAATYADIRKKEELW